ncbi:MAG: alpha/beta fold hydrolase, partial [Saprospiraceae bacterium]|nr:alpha/beta fold hydrolase [Saprospiraceae bacterium]
MPNALPNLPMQMMMSMTSWLSSPSGFPPSNAGFPLWNPTASANQLNPAEQAKLSQAIANEAKNRAEGFLKGLLRYTETPYRRTLKEPPAIWRKGNARLLDYSERDADGPVVIFLPSLINRYYILDLDEERSLLRHAASTGACTLVLDWGAPGKSEIDFSCADYVSDVLLQAIEFVQRSTGKKVTLAGYCMGGVMALAATILKPQLINSIALFATPWNFHCKSFSPYIFSENWHPTIDAMLSKKETLAADTIQSLFYWTDPWVFENKYRRFAEMEDDKEIDEFVALEQWVNDGVPMTAPAARECLIGWA